ncbi:hypothetical protein K435DRAFT_806520 [Dendrothele bispora CBS 962.96]|uniref:Uncharacterized protein n=1 Tax=Dendrothele bispora (strain CBS 962.96) TaxID=1314807 RepID=A0A4S8L7K3_DENBC|nr:hypothetical protein K435DRAFT_806520 [Dendrothele bispora CBS 962.96]
MPRPKLYHTKAERLCAHRVKSLKYYEKNRDKINESRRRTYQLQQQAQAQAEEKERRVKQARTEKRKLKERSNLTSQLMMRVNEQYRGLAEQLKGTPTAFFDTLYQEYVYNANIPHTPSTTFADVITLLTVTVDTMEKTTGQLYQVGGVTRELKEAEELTRKVQLYLTWAEDLQCGAMEGLTVLEMLYKQHRLKFQSGSMVDTYGVHRYLNTCGVQSTNIVSHLLVDPDLHAVASSPRSLSRRHKVLQALLLEVLHAPAAAEPDSTERQRSSQPLLPPPPTQPSSQISTEPPTYSASLSGPGGNATKSFFGWLHAPPPEVIKARWPNAESSGGYIVARGLRVGFFADWPIVKALTNGVSGMYQQRFSRFDLALEEYTQSNELFSHNDPSLKNRDLEFQVDRHCNIRVSPATQDQPPAFGDSMPSGSGNRSIVHVSVSNQASQWDQEIPGVETWRKQPNFFRPPAATQHKFGISNDGRRFVNVTEDVSQDQLSSDYEDDDFDYYEDGEAYFSVWDHDHNLVATDSHLQNLSAEESPDSAHIRVSRSRNLHSDNPTRAWLDYRQEYLDVLLWLEGRRGQLGHGPRSRCINPKQAHSGYDAFIRQYGITRASGVPVAVSTVQIEWIIGTGLQKILLLIGRHQRHKSTLSLGLRTKQTDSPD